MVVKAFKTHKIEPNEDLFAILDQYLPLLEERTIVAITSKIISICQGDLVKNDGAVDKRELIKQEADLYLDVESDYGIVMPTIKNNVFLANAGVDESNADGNFILWPRHLDETTNAIWEHLRSKYAIKELGVIVTDSRLMPLTWGITGVGIAWCGFEASKDYRGQPDIFGRPLKMSQKGNIQGLAAAAVVVTGEGDEQTPLATITDIPFITFQDRPPNQEERDIVRIDLKNDIFGAILNAVDWKKGEGKK